MFLEAPFNLLKTVHGMYNLQTHYRQSVYHYIDKLPIVTVIDCLPLCTHTLWAYAPILYGLMHPCFMGLCTHTLWGYASMLYGLMHPYFMGLCTHTLWAYAPILYGLMHPYSMGLCVHTLGSYTFHAAAVSRIPTKCA